MYAKKSNAKKIIVTLLAVVMLIGGTIGGTLAWLSATSGTVTNTFTVGNIWIDLYEHTRDNDGKLTTTEVKALSDYKIIPGTSEEKDPTVEVLANSENCWVFIQVQELNNVAATDDTGATTHKYVTWNIDSDVWTKLSESNGVVTYYATTSYTTQNTDKTYDVLSDKKVSYGDSLTKAMIDLLYAKDDNGNIIVNTEKQPQLNFKAFAVQAEAGTAASAAWAQIPTTEYLGYVAPTT